MAEKNGEGKSLDDDPPIGTRVLVHGKLSGIIRFKGKTQFKPGDWVGVELDRPLGKNNGTVKGVVYFKCRPCSGVFVRPGVCIEFSNTEHAVNAIQSASRMHLAKKKVKSERNARTWNVLDNHIEEMNVKTGKMIFEASRSLGEQAGKQKPDTDVLEIDTNSIQIEEDYDGVHLTFPLTLDNVLDMLDSFKGGKTLHIKYMLQLLEHFRMAASRAPTLLQVPVEEGTKLTICGDIHGQLQDLYTIFTINGLPSPTNCYLFNGDLVDRGTAGAEVVASLAAFQLLLPRCVFINRGNHEARAQNSWMGFEEEIFAKYSGDSPNVGVDAGGPDRQRMPRDLLNMFQLCFDALPLCAVVAGKVFVTHGGLFRTDGITLEQLKAIKRVREPPLEGKTLEEKIFEDLLWSDPRPSVTYPRPLVGRRTSERGAGVEFGADVTQRFCADNGIALVVRSHECIQEGYEVLHNGRLITIFSASRYCGTQTNKGAFITFGPDLQPEIQQFFAHSIETNRFKRILTDDQREQALEDDAVRLIIERVCDHKSDLYRHFMAQDEARTGLVSRVQWAQALQTVLGMDLHFLYYQPLLADAREDGDINYVQFLERYRITMRPEDSGWQDAIIERVCLKLYDACATVTDAFHVFDRNSDGNIAYDEFLNTLKGLDVGLTDEQIFELMRSVDTDRDGRIDAREFASRFQLEFAKLQRAKPRPGGAGDAAGAGDVSDGEDGGEAKETDEWAMKALSTIGEAILNSKLELPAAFAKFDTNNDGKVSPEGFCATLRSELHLMYSDEELQRLFRAVDTNSSGKINYLEFVNAFKVRDTKGTGTEVAGPAGSAGGWQATVLHMVANVFYQHRIQLMAAFRMFDSDNDGKISAPEFRSGLKSFNALLDSPLSEVQMEDMRAALDRNGDGSIDYKEFLEGFAILDTSRNMAVPGSESTLSPRRSMTFSPRVSPRG